MQTSTTKSKTRREVKSQKSDSDPSRSNVEHKKNTSSQEKTQGNASQAGFSEQSLGIRPSQIDADEWIGGVP